jgi:hypothetical protein
LLPLDDCDRGARCGCSYRHEPDRRRGARRSDEAGLPPTRKLDVREKRSAARRRVDDHDPADDFDDPLDDTYYDFVARKLD